MTRHSRTELWLGSSVLAVAYGFGGHSESFCSLRDVSIFTARNAVKDFLNDRFGWLEALTLTRHGLLCRVPGGKLLGMKGGVVWDAPEIYFCGCLVTPLRTLEILIPARKWWFCWCRNEFRSNLSTPMRSTTRRLETCTSGSLRFQKSVLKRQGESGAGFG